jgi:hypothetical protein
MQTEISDCCCYSWYDQAKQYSTAILTYWRGCSGIYCFLIFLFQYFTEASASLWSIGIPLQRQCWVVFARVIVSTFIFVLGKVGKLCTEFTGLLQVLYQLLPKRPCLRCLSNLNISNKCNQSKQSRQTTVDGQNIQTLQHALCWTPAPLNLNVSARACYQKWC